MGNVREEDVVAPVRKRVSRAVDEWKKQHGPVLFLMWVGVLLFLYNSGIEFFSSILLTWVIFFVAANTVPMVYFYFSIKFGGNKMMSDSE